MQSRDLGKALHNELSSTVIHWNTLPVCLTAAFLDKRLHSNQFVTPFLMKAYISSEARDGCLSSDDINGPSSCLRSVDKESKCIRDVVPLLTHSNDDTSIK